MYFRCKYQSMVIPTSLTLTLFAQLRPQVLQIAATNYTHMQFLREWQHFYEPGPLRCFQIHPLASTCIPDPPRCLQILPTTPSPWPSQPTSRNLWQPTDPARPASNSQTMATCFHPDQPRHLPALVISSAQTTNHATDSHPAIPRTTPIYTFAC